MNARVEALSVADREDAVGDLVLQGLRERLAGSASLIVNGGRGFARIGARLAQHVDVEPPRVLNGSLTTRITSTILVLQDLHGDADEIERVLTRYNEFAESYRYVYDAAAGTVTSHQSAVVHEGSWEWWTPLLATALALQLTRRRVAAHPEVPSPSASAEAAARDGAEGGGGTGEPVREPRGVRGHRGGRAGARRGRDGRGEQRHLVRRAVRPVGGFHLAARGR
jgi:hypothetical protein